MTDRNSQMEEFKQEIRAVLTPSQNGVPLNKLYQVYYDFMGKNIPYKALGFNSEYELFQAVPDAVKLVRHGTYTIAFARSNEKTAHIASLVGKQKKATTDYRKVNTRPRFSNLPPRMQRSHPVKSTSQPNLPRCVPPNLKQYIQNLLAEHPKGINIDNLKIAFRRKYGLELNHQEYNYARIIDFVKALNGENAVKLVEGPNSFSVFHPNYLGQQDLSGASHQKSGNTLDEKVENTGKSNLSNKQQSSNENINDKVYSNLEKLVQCFPDGFPLTELCEQYKAVSGSLLKVRELGFNDVAELVENVPELFSVVLKGGQWFLVDAKSSLEDTQNVSEGGGPEKEIPGVIQQNIYQLLNVFSDGILLSQFERVYKMNYELDIPWEDLRFKSLHSMLMAVNFHNPLRFTPAGLNDLRVVLTPKELSSDCSAKDHAPTKSPPDIPVDAVVLGEVYKPAKICHDNGTWFAVTVSSVDSPGTLWLQEVCQEEKRNVELDQLMDDMEEFYTSPEANRYKVPDYLLKNLLNCAVVYPDDQNWHRGCIIGKPGPTTYEVFYYDYGTVSVVESYLFRLLKKRFKVLPAQASCVRLANVQPQGKFYSEAASRRLFSLIRSGKPLMAMVTNRHYMSMISVLLCDTSGDDDIFLNDLLIQEDLVGMCQDYVEMRSPATSPATLHIPNHNLPGTHQDSDYGKSAPCLLLHTIRQPPGLERLMPTQNVEYAAWHGIYEPPSDSLPKGAGGFAIDPEIVKRVGEQNVYKKKSLNLSPKEDSTLPRAAVEPIQFSQISGPKDEVLVPLSPVNQLGISARPTEVQNPVVQNHLPQTTHDEAVYESSVDDEHLVISENAPICSKQDIPLQTRFCKKMEFTDEAYSAHLINFYGKPCITSIDVSSFIFGIDIVKKILHIQNYPPCHILATRAEHPALFRDLEYSKVLGFKSGEPKLDKVVLYVLLDAVKILKFLNYQRQPLLQDIEESYNTFDNSDNYWQTNVDFSDGDDLPDCVQSLEAKLQEVREERKQLLKAMLDEDSSNVQNTEKLLTLEKHLKRLKERLSHLSEEAKTKTAADLAREFLERVTFHKEDKQKEATPIQSTPPPVNIVSSAPATTVTSTAATTVIPATQMMFFANRPAQAFASSTVTMLPNTPYHTVLPAVNYAPFHQGNILPQQISIHYPPPNFSTRIPGGFMNWQ